jgi:hypothetical protein
MKKKKMKKKKKKIKELENNNESSFYKEYTNYIDMLIKKLTNFFCLMLQLVNAAANVGIILAPIFSGTNYLDMFNSFGFSGRSCKVINLELLKIDNFEKIYYCLLDLIKKINDGLKIYVEEFKLILPNIIKFFFQITIGHPKNIEKYIIAISQTILEKSDDNNDSIEVKTGNDGKSNENSIFFDYKNFIENIKYLNKLSDSKYELINSMNKILKQYEILVQQDIFKLSTKLIHQMKVL